jgi:phospholipid transport system substrate-binding protein
MISRRDFVAAIALAMLWPGGALRAEDAGATPVSIIQSFYDALLSTMKDGQKLGFAGRRDRLAPAIRRSFNFALMTRLMVGPQWQNLPPEQQHQLVDAFGSFSIATYANRFDDFSGESFTVDDTPVKLNNGDLIVKSQLVKSDGDPIELDYLMHEDNGRWLIIDVYLSGTVSELATRRSEFSSVMRRGGPAALVQLLQQKAVELSS